MEIFESSYKNFRRNSPNKQYIFPNNLQYANIIDIVNEWKAYLTKKGKETKNKLYFDVLKYYDDFLNILNNGNLSRAFKREFDNFGKNSPPTSQEELKRIMEAGATATCYTNEKFSGIEEEVAKKGNYKVNVVLNGDRKDNKFYNKMDKYDENSNNYKVELYNNLKLMLGYLEKFVILHTNPFKTIQPKYSKIIANNINSKEKIYDEYSKYLNKFYDLYFSNEFEFKLPQKELKNIADDLFLWKSSVNDIRVKKELDNAINCLKNEESPNENLI